MDGRKFVDIQLKRSVIEADSHSQHILQGTNISYKILLAIYLTITLSSNENLTKKV